MCSRDAKLPATEDVADAFVFLAVAESFGQSQLTGIPLAHDSTFSLCSQSGTRLAHCIVGLIRFHAALRE